MFVHEGLQRSSSQGFIIWFWNEIQSHLRALRALILKTFNILGISYFYTHDNVVCISDERHMNSANYSFVVINDWDHADLIAIAFNFFKGWISFTVALQRVESSIFIRIILLHISLALSMTLIRVGMFWVLGSPSLDLCLVTRWKK